MLLIYLEPAQCTFPGSYDPGIFPDHGTVIREQKGLYCSSELLKMLLFTGTAFH